MQSSQATPATLPGGPDAVLVERLRRGDGAAFEELLRAHSGRLLAVVRRLLGNEEDARDAVQDTFLSAFRSIDRFDGQAALATWLHRIAVNAALTKLRSRRRHPEKPIEDLLPTFLEDGHQARPSRNWPEPSAALQRQETREAVRRHIAELPEDYRVVLLLRDIEELDTDETARLLGLTTGAVKTRLHRARQALRALLEPEFRGGD
ncbi:MAG TPA: sigma-70 family RNA polymerase sigma factor [Gemmataceae bacterium]|nr:sigma-70 family RNA polymerase sigma factor [Gemmataceae bacterium]